MLNFLVNFLSNLKHFNNNILLLNEHDSLNALQSHEIDNLNIEGLIQSSIIKHNQKIENYSKKLLKSIFS